MVVHCLVSGFNQPGFLQNACRLVINNFWCAPQSSYLDALAAVSNVGCTCKCVHTWELNSRSMVRV